MVLLLLCVCNKLDKFIPLILLSSMTYLLYEKLKSNTDNILITGGNTNMVNVLPLNKIVEYMNPEFVVKQIKSPKFKFTLIDEGVLIGGSKQRIMPMVLSQINEKKIIYAGPSTGYTQVALSYTCRMMGKQAILFLDCTKYDKSPLTEIAKKFGAVVYYFNPKIKAKRLQYISNQASIWKKKNKDSFILPFGLNDSGTIKLYSGVFAKLKKLNPKRLWIVARSGLIFTSLSKILTNTKFMIIQVGKKIWPDQLKGINHRLFVSEYRFKENIEEIPPYDTLLNYDAKAWPFILKYGEEGDYIWNTASSPKPSYVYDNELHKIENMKEPYYLNKYMITPKHNLSMSNPTDMFNGLVYIAHNWKQSDLVHRNFTRDYYNIDGISNHFTEDVRMDCVVNRDMKISPNRFVNNNKKNIAMKTIFLYGKSPDVNRNILDTLSTMYGYRECNSFNPLIIINFIKRYFKDVGKVDLLDPSMGWGDRLLACMALGINSYTGFDPNLNLHPHYNKIAKLRTDIKTKFIPDKFSSKGLTYKFDAVFTSPPFFNIELYQYSEEDVAISYSQWLEDMYIPYLNDMVESVKDNGYVGIYIDNIGKFKTGDDTNRILEEKMGFVERLVFQNDYYDINGILHTGRPRSLWVYRKNIKGGDESPVDPLVNEYNRYSYVKLVIDKLFNDLLKNNTMKEKIRYESKNISERLLLACANNSVDNKLKDPVLNLGYNYKNYKDDIKYQIKTKKYLNGKINLNAHVSSVESIVERYGKSRPVRKPDYSITYDGYLCHIQIGEYKRTISKHRMELLLKIGGEKNVINMIMRYACIISGPQHWEAPIEYFRILYDIGVRFEGFSSPVNSNFLLEEFKDTNICSLFYDTDKHFNSIGSFFNVDFLKYEDPMIVVGPPYYDELILKIANKIQDTCVRAKKLNRKIRFVLTHSNSWDYIEGFRILKQSEFLTFDHVFKKNEHYYNNDKGEKITARFETRLFVMECGMDIKPHSEALKGIFHHHR